MSARKRPGKSLAGAFDGLLTEVPAEAEAIAPLEGREYAERLERARARAWEQLTERDYERWNGQLILQIWRLQGRIPVKR